MAVGRFTVPCHHWNSLAHLHDDALAAGRMMMTWHCRPFPCSLVQRWRRGADDGGLLLRRRRWGADESALALLCNGIVPLDSRPSLTCSRMARMESAWTDGGGSGGGASNDGGNGSGLSTVPLLAHATTSWRRGGQQCLGGHTRSAEGQGRNIERNLRLDEPPIFEFALGGV